MKIKSILLTLLCPASLKSLERTRICALILCATALNLPVHAQNLYVDGTAHPAESGTTYTAVIGANALTVINPGGSYTGDNITLINSIPDSESNWHNGAFVFNEGQLSLTDSNITAPIGVVFQYSSSGTLNNVNIEATENGVQVMLQSTLELTGGSIIGSGGQLLGIALGLGNATVKNVNIEGAQLGVMVMQSTLELTGASITLTGDQSIGIMLMEGSSTATVSGVNINSEAYSMGIGIDASSILTMADSTINTPYSGVVIQANSSGTLNNVNITATMDNDGTVFGAEVGGGVNILDSSTLALTGGSINTSGSSSHGINFDTSSGTLKDVNITTTGEDAHALHLVNTSAVTANLNNKTLTGGIAVEASSTLTLSGSNGTLLTGDITSANNSTINLTLTGNGSKLIGNVTQDVTSTVTLDISDGATLGDAATANTINGEVTIHDGGHISTTLTLTNGITLEAGAILDYAGNADGLLAPGSPGTIHIASGILVDFSGVTLTDETTYIIADFGEDYSGYVGITKFTAIGLGDMTGEFYEDPAHGRLEFTAHAVPEPSIYILLGIGLGILLLTVRRRVRS
jgi:hypothetical protein